MYWAALHGHVNMVKVILQQDSETEPQWISSYKHALVVAATRGHADIVEQLLRIPDLDPDDFFPEDRAPIREEIGRAHV